MNDFGKIVDSSTVRFERLLPGPIERVWDHLTKPEFLATWLAVGQMDARVGGRVELQTIGIRLERSNTHGWRRRTSRRPGPQIPSSDSNWRSAATTYFWR
jgi:hypothetical protein